jgi:hypothetical protein
VDPVDYYGSRFLATVTLFGIALILYSLIRYRGRASGPFAWGLLILGVGLVPAASSALGTVLCSRTVRKSTVLRVLPPDYAAQVVDIPRNAKSHSLAAVH